MRINSRTARVLGRWVWALVLVLADGLAAPALARAQDRNQPASGVSAQQNALMLHVAAPQGAAAASTPAQWTKAVAQDGLPPHFDLTQALALFEARGFDLLMAEAHVAYARGELRTAGAVANPLVSGSIGHTGGRYSPSACGTEGCSATAYNLSVTDQAALSDVITGKRGLRRDVAQAALEAAAMGRDDAHRTLRVMLKSQYLAVAIDGANLKFLMDVQASYANTYDLFATRYAAGDISEADLVRMETAALESEQNVDAAQEQVRVDKVALSFLLGVRGPTPSFELEASWLEKIAHNALIEVPESHWLEVACDRRPDLQAQALLQKRAQAAIRLSTRARVPDIALNFLFQQEGNSETAIQPPTYSGGLTLALPVFYQFQGEVQKARADLVTQDIAQHKLEAQVVADVAQAYATMTAGHRRLARMQSKLRAKAARGLELVQLQYEKGAASLLDLLDAQRTFIAINQEYIGDLSAFWQALFQLEGAVAMELEP